MGTVEKPSWIQRLGSSFRGVVTGFVLFIAGIGLLFWNEGRAVDTAKRLKEGAASVVEVPADQIDPANEGKLVHVSGKADTQEVLTDAEFGVSVNALRLQRTVEIYQTVERIVTKQEKKDGKTVDVQYPTYKDEWCSKPVDSSQFQEAPKRGVNPEAMPYVDVDQFAANATLGAFKLSEAHLKGIKGLKEYVFPTNYVAPKNVQKSARYLYVPFVPAAESPGQFLMNTIAMREVAAHPKLGDVRVSFKVLMPCDVSIIEGQRGNELVPWTTPKGEVLQLMIRNGTVPAATMFAEALSSNAKWTWFLRFVGILVMYIGLKMVLGPIDTLVEMIPILNGIVAMGTSLAAGLVAGASGLLTIGISWIYHRPWVGIPLVLGGAGLLALVFSKKKKSSASAV